MAKKIIYNANVTNQKNFVVIAVSAQLESLFFTAMTNAFGKSHWQALIQVANKQQQGDYQSNAAFALAKQLQQSPQAVAEQLLAHLPTNDIIEETSISGPGFINIRLTPACVSASLINMLQSPQAGINPSQHPETIVVDYGSPNVAKAMHVGHLRSTIIGDALVRLLNAKGHHLIRQNHVGDWGTQFGMLIEHIIQEKLDLHSLDSIQELNTLYQASKKRFDTDEVFAKAAKERVVALQAGTPDTLALWQILVAKSQEHFQSIYNQLGVLLTQDDIRGESSYNDDLPKLIDDLEKHKYLTISQGAKVLFLEGFVDKDKNPLPMILQKSDGGYLYATTDMVTAKYRIENLKANRIIYVVDCRQRQHFDMLFAAVKHVGYADNSVRLDYVPFGAMLGDDRKPFKTRSGQVIELASLIDEAIKRAYDLYKSKNPDATDVQAMQVAKVVGVGALKYADLSNDKIKDIVFDWEQMLAFDGNTAPYLLNAYVRIASILRKADDQDGNPVSWLLESPQELDLAKHLIQFPELIDQLSIDLAIHRLCQFLYKAANLFHRFYEHCPILNANHETKQSRLKLCLVTQNVLHTGLNLLGIETLESM